MCNNLLTSYICSCFGHIALLMLVCICMCFVCSQTAEECNQQVSSRLLLTMPYRAKLEEALKRMDRVVDAIERDSAQASPYTAQLAVQLDDSDAADSVSPALQQVALHHACCCAIITLMLVLMCTWKFLTAHAARRLDLPARYYLCKFSNLLCSGGLHSQPSLAQ